MNFNFKNALTNLFGIVLWASATYLLYINIKSTKSWDWVDLALIALLVFLGVVLFRFENKPLQDITKGFLTKIKNKL